MTIEQAEVLLGVLWVVAAAIYAIGWWMKQEDEFYERMFSNDQEDE